MIVVLEVLWFAWWVGVFASLIALPLRAGLSKRNTGVDWREFLLANVSWFAVYYFGKAAAWPVVLYTWLDEGRPPSPWRAVTELNGRPTRRIVRVA